MFSRQTPLAWLNLVHDKRRLIVSIAGIGLAVILMFVQLGFWNALLDASVSMVRQLNGQLIIVNKARYAVSGAETFPRRYLAQVKPAAGVTDAFPIYFQLNTGIWHNPEATKPDEPSRRPIRVIAIDPNDNALKISGVREHRNLLRQPRTLLLDRRSKAGYGKREKGIERELAKKKIEVVGTFELGPDFTTDGNVVMSDQTYAQLFPNPLDPMNTLAYIDLGVVQVQQGIDIETIRKDLQKRLPADVSVMTLDEFVAQERYFWQTATPVGFIFTFGLIMGVIVGMVICSQILSADVSDHLKEYATLKAIGYSNGYLTVVVLQQALWLAVFGFGPALGISYLLYIFLSDLTGLPLFLTLARITIIFVLTTVMCIGSGLLALRKVQTADPAEVF